MKRIRENEKIKVPHRETKLAIRPSVVHKDILDNPVCGDDE
jgi:hypothetical protein